ncbi:antitoxin Xre/MbcA/ParS toxin-binding domain-containing protein [Microbulbifer hydrolyticus]|uniref:DUF2384 domain-containing protein n=1 Tax=Microbulbifer hydrolyticus TaxID=48074 RepID=A0A6P1T7L9_9GAMM|nr:antitoxin Xre/MbcA/ParS toxin-binding domain-containing protein [Microbulbifer hydrolyticus]MBB5211467.1 uncharacterized protein (DUF2384 family) [Microbulbifer hydrolyticus]QHQ37781.1 DUF2384 domain-containing protein [Microbulbifer hydrolyticus]
MKGRPEERGWLGRMLFKLFDHWQINTHQRLSLLGLDPESPIDPNEYLSRGYFASDYDKLERVSILLGIHKSLRLLFPGNRDLVYQWVSQPNKYFDGLTPVEIVERHGMLGMYMVRGYLDQQLSGRDLFFEKQTKASPATRFVPDQDDTEWLSATETDNESHHCAVEKNTEKILQLLDVWTLAVRVFSSEEKAKLWFVTRVPAIGCPPAALLPTNGGREKVIALLKRIEQGDFGG